MRSPTTGIRARSSTTPGTPRSGSTCWPRGPCGRTTNGCRRRSPPGRVHRKLSYGPLLDVFVLDMRTVKDVNDGNTYADPTRGLLGAEQREWLIRGLKHSRGPPGRSSPTICRSVWSCRTVRPRRRASPRVTRARRRAGRLEFAEVLRSAHRAGVSGIVLLTADVHYTAAHHYDPARAAVAGLHAVLGVRLRPGPRRGVRPERAGRHVRPAGGVRARSAGRRHLARAGLPALRRGVDRRADRRVHRASARP